MNILVINGSPKGENSNTLRLTDAFLEGICDQKKNSLPQIKRLHIAQMDIRPCRGCFFCWKTVPGTCCIKDDMQLVLEKLLWADLVIWSFPLYYFSLPGHLKTVIDRQLPLSLPFMLPDSEGGGHPARYDMSGKKTILISTCGFYTSKSNYNSIEAQFDRICGKDKYTSLFCGEGELFAVPELSKQTQTYLEKVYQAGAEYISGGIREETRKTLEEPILPRDVFERMADASWGVAPSGEKQEASLTFTRQMASLYNPESYRGTDILLDMDYTDIGKRYRVVLGQTESCVLEEFDGLPTTVIHTPFKVWEAIAKGEMEGSEALMKHLYSVEGSFDVMMRWNEYFGQASNVEQGDSKSLIEEKTDMRYVLTPWIVLWVAASIHIFWGSLISIFVSCLLPMVFYKNKKTVYDVISGAAVSVFSMMLLIRIPSMVVIPMSYFAFGLMWSISALRDIPLSAEYSKNDYGGDRAFRNPLFIKTNRILTAAWGVLYLLTPIWTYFIMRTDARMYIGLINSILPAIMGVFTARFQKWYPQKIARGSSK